MTRIQEEGFSLVEVMIGMLLLSILSIGFYQVMFSTVRGSNSAADVAQSAEEARLGFNRMIRDTREATRLVSASSSGYRIWVDFDGDGCVDAGTAYVKPAGTTVCVAGGPSDYEYLRYAFDGDEVTLEALAGPANGTAATCAPMPAASATCGLSPGDSTLVAGTVTETLASGVRTIGSKPVFSYASNFLEFDDSPTDGETTVTELGDGDNDLEGLELEYISDVNYAFEVSIGGNARKFYGQAQIRNRRYSDL